jgi:hypothetical protein
MLLWAKKYITINITEERYKCKIYNTLIRPVILYGNESWTLTKADEEKLKIFKRSILGNIYGPTRENGVWRIKYNDEPHSLYRD